MKKVLEGTVSLPGKYSKLIEESMLGYKHVLVKTGRGTIDFGWG